VVVLPGARVYAESVIHTAPARDRLQAYLREHGVCFTLRHHPLAFSAHEVAEAEHIPDERLAKAVVLVANREPVLVVLPAAYQVHLGKLSVALHAREVHLADEQLVARLFDDCEVGAIPLFGNLYGLEVLVDRTLAAHEHLEFRAGTHTETIGMAYADFARLTQPTVIDIGRHR
jgi:Ala-tRNA(Pro) deacylase